MRAQQTYIHVAIASVWCGVRLPRGGQVLAWLLGTYTLQRWCARQHWYLFPLLMKGKLCTYSRYGSVYIAVCWRLTICAVVDVTTNFRTCCFGSKMHLC